MIEKIISKFLRPPLGDCPPTTVVRILTLEQQWLT